MERDVVIILDGKVVWRGRISEGGLNYDPTEDDVRASAWRAAIEDGAVKPEDRAKAVFELTEPTY